MPSCSTERACEKQAGEDHPPVFLWAFASGGWFLANSRALDRKRVSDGILFPIVFLFLSLTGDFLPIAAESHPPEEKRELPLGKVGRRRQDETAIHRREKLPPCPPTQKGTCHGTFLFAGHFFVSAVIRLLPCFSFAPQGRGCCWVIQWILPPPKATSRVCTPTTSRSGNISCT